ncbi:MAG TPA: DMT family transporter [Acetobacteraceae bacterium]|nr:DMT family transporter [Acetobacteraceae bacterium]
MDATHLPARSRVALQPGLNFAPFAFVLLWSSSFIASRAGLRHLSPLLFVAVRMVIAAAALIVLMVVLDRSWRVLAGRWGHLAVSGVLTNSLLLMTAHYAMVHTGAAQIALVQTLNPLLTALLAWPVLGEKLRPLQWLGLLLGATGVLLIVGMAALRSPVELHGLLLTVGGVVGLCSGTLYFGRFCRGTPMLEGTTVQFAAAAVACVVAAILFETPHAVWNEVSIAALAWNVLAVSLGGMALYYFMLSHGTAARAAANFYLVPGTASLLAWVLLGEALSLLTISGLVVSSIGCWLVARRE